MNSCFPMLTRAPFKLHQSYSLCFIWLLKAAFRHVNWIRHTVVSHEINRLQSMDVSEVSKWRVGCLKVLPASLMLIKADVTFREHTNSTQPLCSGGCKCSGNPLFVCLRVCVLASCLMSELPYLSRLYRNVSLFSFSQSFKFILQSHRAAQTSQKMEEYKCML